MTPRRRHTLLNVAGYAIFLLVAFPTFLFGALGAASAGGFAPRVAFGFLGVSVVSFVVSIRLIAIADRLAYSIPYTCACGYDLRGTTSERCPECGADVRPP